MTATNSTGSWHRIALACLASAAPAFAQDPPRIHAVSHAWIQRGTSAEVVFTGERFADVGEVHVFPEGIEAEVLNDEPEKKPAAAPDPMPAPTAPAKAGAKKGKPAAVKKPAAKKAASPAPKPAAGAPSM